MKLQNRFSVALQTLPIECGIDLEDTFRHKHIRNRILAVKRYADVLRSSSDYMVRFVDLVQMWTSRKLKLYIAFATDKLLDYFKNDVPLPGSHATEDT